MAVAGAVGIGMFFFLAFVNAKLDKANESKAKKMDGKKSSPDKPAELPAGKASVSIQYCGA